VKTDNQQASVAFIVVQEQKFQPQGLKTAAVRVAVAFLWAGVFALNAAAAGLADVPVGEWVEVPNTRLVDVAAGGSPGGSIRKITAWSGAAYDSRRNQLLVWGGGHSDYGGNEVYAFDLDDLAWRRLTEPSAADRSRAPFYPDGRPRARHTYNYIEYLPSRDRLVSFGGSGPYPTGGGEFTRDQVEFDPGSGRWQPSGRAAVPRTGNMIGAHARLDPATGDVYFLGSQKASPMRYESATDRWVEGWGKTHVRVHSTAAIDTDRRLLVVVGSGGDSGQRQLLAWRLDQPGPAQDLTKKSRGDTGIEAAYGPGFDYHPPTRRFVAWAGGKDVFVLDPGTWIWTRVPGITGQGADPGPPNRTGTYGRFRYVAPFDLFVLVNGAESNVYLYRMPDKHGAAELSRVSTDQPRSDRPEFILRNSSTFRSKPQIRIHRPSAVKAAKTPLAEGVQLPVEPSKGSA
jgi:hypothetical protein